MDKDLYLESRLAEMLAADGNLKETIAAFNVDSSQDEQSGMIALILCSLHDPSEKNFWQEGVEINSILLEILRNLKSAGYDEVEKPLEGYSTRIHRLEGIRDERRNLLEFVKQHLLLDVGSTVDACKRRSYPPSKIPFTHWRRSL